MNIETMIQLAIVLIICQILFSNWQPPIKAQYQLILLGLIGIGLAYFLNLSLIWGFCCAGLVFYKGELVEEFKLVVECYRAIGNKEK